MRRGLTTIVLLLALAAPAAAPAAAVRGTLQIGERMLPGPVFTEGAVSFARVTRIGGAVVHDGSLPARPWRGALLPGRYRVSTWVRPCEGTCAVLDPAMGRCSGTVLVHAGRVTRLTVLRRAGETCRLRTA